MQGSDEQLFTTKQAADFLGLTRDSIYKHVQHGRLKRVASERGDNGRTRHLYLREDVELLARHIEEKPQSQSRIDEVAIRAARAEATASRVERHLEDLYELLGMKQQLPDLSVSSLRIQHRTAVRQALEDEVPFTMQEAVDLAKQVYRINEEQLRALELLMKDPEPWVCYTQAVKRAIMQMSEQPGDEARACNIYLQAALNRLRGVAFEYVRQAYGHVRAEQLAAQQPDPPDEHIIRILTVLLDAKSR